MTIRNRHTQISSLTFGVVFTISSLLVYYAFYRSSERIIFSELERTCMLSAVFYLEEDELSVREHNIVRKQFEENILNADVKIYNSENQITFGNKRVDVHITPEILDNVRKERKLNFKAGDHYYYGVFYPDNQGDFVVFIASDNEFFASQNRQLLFMLAIALLLGLAVIFLLSHWLSRIAYKPISRIIN